MSAHRYARGLPSATTKGLPTALRSKPVGGIGARASGHAEQLAHPRELCRDREPEPLDLHASGPGERVELVGAGVSIAAS